MTTVPRRKKKKPSVTVVRRPRVVVTQEMLDAVAAERDAVISRLSRIQSVITLVDNGAYVVGWSTCGGCLYSIRHCTCVDGPTPPKYIREWMAQPPVEVTP